MFACPQHGISVLLRCCYRSIYHQHSNHSFDNNHHQHSVVPWKELSNSYVLPITNRSSSSLVHPLLANVATILKNTGSCLWCMCWTSWLWRKDLPGHQCHQAQAANSVIFGAIVGLQPCSKHKARSKMATASGSVPKLRSRPIHCWQSWHFSATDGKTETLVSMAKPLHSRD